MLIVHVFVLLMYLCIMFVFVQSVYWKISQASWLCYCVVELVCAVSCARSLDWCHYVTLVTAPFCLDRCDAVVDDELLDC